MFNLVSPILYSPIKNKYIIIMVMMMINNHHQYHNHF